MAQVTLESTSEEVVQVVERYAQDKWNEGSGQVEVLAVEIKNLREIVARFLDLAADKGNFTNEELQKVIRGW